jgi:hypothetical protein
MAGNYVQKVFEAARAARVGAGDVVKANIYHDDNCPRLRGGCCTCDPDVRLEWLAAERRRGGAGRGYYLSAAK